MTTLALPYTAARSASVRTAALDRLRGLAIALMVLDHLLALTGAGHPLRVTLTRAAMPLFFVISGHLAHRLTRRHAFVFAVGFFLPALVPWIDNPNVLCLYVVGAAILVACRRRRGLVGLVLIVALTLYANGFVPVAPEAYSPWAVIGLMCVGALAQRETLAAVGDRLPAFLAGPGRFPLSVYVGHLLLLQLLFFGRFGA